MRFPDKDEELVDVEITPVYPNKTRPFLPSPTRRTELGPEQEPEQGPELGPEEDSKTSTVPDGEWTEIKKPEKNFKNNHTVDSIETDWKPANNPFESL